MHLKFNSANSTNELNVCISQLYSPLCFCRSSNRRLKLTNLFLGKLSVFQCNNTSSNHQCRRSRFYPPSFDLTQLIPQLTNYSHCFDNKRCFHTLNSIQYCQSCQLTPSSILTTNYSYSTDTCFNICEHNLSCGFICLNQPVVISINCKICRNRTRNISCRCINPSSSCLPLTYETTTVRWMQKRGFPAAAILVLLIAAVTIFVLIIKLIYCQIDRRARRRSLLARQATPLQRTRLLEND